MPIYAWVQDPPQITTATAQVAVTAAPTVAVRASATAAVAPAARFGGGSAQSGPAAVAVFPNGRLAARLGAAATLSFAGSASTAGGSLVTVAPASAAITSGAAVTPAAGGAAVVLMVAAAGQAPMACADAVLGFADFGAGSDPVFPFRFPMLFVGESRAQAAATAVVTAAGSADLDAVAATAQAVIAVDGDTAVTLSGSTPVFPWVFPVAFTPPGAATQLAIGQIEISATATGSAAATAPAVLVVEAAAAVLSGAVFPFRFPALIGA